MCWGGVGDRVCFSGSSQFKSIIPYKNKENKTLNVLAKFVS